MGKRAIISFDFNDQRTIVALRDFISSVSRASGGDLLVFCLRLSIL